MEATFTISEEDYVRAARLGTQLTGKQLAFAAAACLAIGLVVLSVSHQIAYSALVALSGILGGGLGYYTVLFCTGFLARRHYRNYKLIQDPVAIQLQEDGIRLRSHDYEGAVRWENILKWRQNDQYFLIYPAPRLYNIIPKTISEQGFDLAALTQQLEVHVGKAK